MDEWIQAKFILRFHSSFFRSKKISQGAKIMKNKSENLEEKFNSKKPAVSNSRLSVHTVPTFDISFDRITLVGDLIPECEKQVSDFVSIDSSISVLEALSSKFKIQHVLDDIYIEYDKFKGKSLQRKNMRIEFNPNNLDQNSMNWIKNNFLKFMRDIEFSRLDLAFDTEINLADFFIMSDKELKKTVFYGRDDKPETRYFGTRQSDRYIRIYNKKQEIKDNKDLEIAAENLWRIEFELKREMTEKWEFCFDDLSFIKPDWKSIEKISERSMIYLLLNEEGEWGNINRKTKYKYKNILKDISPIDLKNNMQEELEMQQERLKKELQFWLT